MTSGRGDAFAERKNGVREGTGRAGTKKKGRNSAENGKKIDPPRYSFKKGSNESASGKTEIKGGCREGGEVLKKKKRRGKINFFKARADISRREKRPKGQWGWPNRSSQGQG